MLAGGAPRANHSRGALPVAQPFPRAQNSALRALERDLGPKLADALRGLKSICVADREYACWVFVLPPFSLQRFFVALPGSEDQSSECYSYLDVQHDYTQHHTVRG